MTAQERGRTAVRTATAVLAGTGLGVAAAVGGIIAAHGNPIAEQTAQQTGMPGGAGAADRGAFPGSQGRPGATDQQGVEPLPDQEGLDPAQSDPSQGMAGRQDPSAQGWGQQGMQGQGVSPGHGPAMGQSHGS